MRVAQLLESGTDPDAVDERLPHVRPLHAAIVALGEGGSLEAIDLLLRHGASIDATYPGLGASTPLLCALFNDEMEAAHHLIERGADPSLSSDEGDAPLRWAVDNGDYPMLELLLESGAAKTIDKSGAVEGRTALGMAVHRLDLRMVERLLAAGADPSIVDFNRDTAEECLPLWTLESDGVWNEIRKLVKQARQKMTPSDLQRPLAHCSASAAPSHWQLS